MALIKINNSRCVLNRLTELYSDTELSDLVLKVGDRHYNTHKLVLCLRSDVFRTMLTSPTWPEAHSDLITLQEEGECEDVFEDFLKYLYDGQVRLTKNTVLPLLMLADKYNVPDLSASCLKYVSSNCIPESQGRVVSWLQYAMFCGNKKVEKICFKYIVYNFESLITTHEFVNLHKDTLVTFLKSSALVINSEYQLYTAMKIWLQSNQSHKPEENKDLFHKVMCLIRFPMMQLRQLANLESDPFVAQYKEFYLRRIFSAIKYHTTSSPLQRRQLITCASDRKHFTPRNYLNECWSTIVTVSNFSKLTPGDVLGAFFTTQVSCSETDQQNLTDWHVHLYPKGTKFDPCLMIGVPANVHISGTFFKNVRLAVQTSCELTRKVEITVLVFAARPGQRQHVCKAVTSRAIFNKDSPLFNLDYILPFDELSRKDSPYLVHPDTFQLRIIIKPDAW